MGYAEYKDPFEKTLVIDSSKLKEHCDSLAEILDYYRSLLPGESVVRVAEKVEDQNACVKRSENEFFRSPKFWFVYSCYWEYLMSKPTGHSINTVHGHPIADKAYDYALTNYGPGAIGSVRSYCGQSLLLMVDDGIIERISKYQYVVKKSNFSDGNS
jgi:hypothetical protein